MAVLKRLRFDSIHLNPKRKSGLTHVALVFILLASGGCAQITVKPGPNESFSSSEHEADYERSMPYYLFGIVGVRHVDVRTICKERKVAQLRSVHTAKDVFKTIITLGLYMPKTAQVWCAPNNKNK